MACPLPHPPNILPSADLLTAIPSDVNFIYTTTTSASLSSFAEQQQDRNNNSSSSSSTGNGNAALTTCCSPSPLQYLAAADALPEYTCPASPFSAIEEEEEQSEPTGGILWCELPDKYLDSSSSSSSTNNSTATKGPLAGFSSCLLGEQGWDYRVLGVRMGSAGDDGNGDQGGEGEGEGDGDGDGNNAAAETGLRGSRRTRDAAGWAVAVAGLVTGCVVVGGGLW